MRHVERKDVREGVLQLEAVIAVAGVVGTERCAVDNQNKRQLRFK